MKIQKNDFDIATLEDEIRVDALCRELLLIFYEETVAAGTDPVVATELARSTDYFVRDFLVDRLQRNIFAETPGTVRRFAGNWYIVTTSEPSPAEVAHHLAGVRAFYRFLTGKGLISPDYLAVVEVECSLLDYYAIRIDSFWQISGDGFREWDQECPLQG